MIDMVRPERSNPNHLKNPKEKSEIQPSNPPTKATVGFPKDCHRAVRRGPADFGVRALRALRALRQQTGDHRDGGAGAWNGSHLARSRNWARKREADDEVKEGIT